MTLLSDEIDLLCQQFQTEQTRHGNFGSYLEACHSDEQPIIVNTESNPSGDQSSSSTHTDPPPMIKHKPTCEVCGGEQTVLNTDGVLICATPDCGVEIGLDISEELECQYAGRAMDDNGSTARSGPVINNLLYESNLKTKISGHRTSYNLRRMVNEWDNLNPEERSLVKDFGRITQICREGRLPNNVINYAQVLFKQATDKQKLLPKGKNSRGDNRTGLILGSIDTSCKKYDINRSHIELAKMAKVNKTIASNGIKLFRKLMGREINLTNHTTSYRDFISRYSYYLNLQAEEIEKVKQICKKVYQSQLLASSKPQTLTAVCIYFTSNLYNFGLERKDIAEKCGTTETTLTKNYRILLEHVTDLIV